MHLIRRTPPRHLNRVRAALAAALLFLGVGVCGCASSVTGTVARSIAGDDSLRALDRAWALPDGGLLLSGRATFGTLTPSAFHLTLPVAQIDAAHRLGPSHRNGHRDESGSAYVLDRAALRPRGPAPRGLHRVPISDALEWSDNDLFEFLSTPPNANQIVFFSRQARDVGVRFVHVRATRTGRHDVAVFTVEPDPEAGSWYAAPLLPVAAAVDASVFAVRFILSVTAYKLAGARAEELPFDPVGGEWLTPYYRLAGADLVRVGERIERRRIEFRGTISAHDTDTDVLEVRSADGKFTLRFEGSGFLSSRTTLEAALLDGTLTEGARVTLYGRVDDVDPDARRLVIDEIDHWARPD